MNGLIGRLSAALGDRYAIERELGAGGMAIVYLAADLKHHRRVAIKVLRPELAASVGRERFFREIEIAARLAHPNILALHDSGEVADTFYYVMPFVEGESLRDRLAREGQLPLDDALRITREIADALGYAHSQGLIHRDVKPENVLFAAGHAVVSDFGIARAVSPTNGASLTEAGLAVGTPAYMSPEQASGVREVDARSDLYALGCVLYEMLTGETPYGGPTPQSILAKKLTEPLPRASVVRSTVSLPLEAVLAKALAREPADRFATAGQLVDALTRASTAPPGARAGRRASSARLRAPAIATVVVLAMILLLASLRGPAWFPIKLAPHLATLAVLPFDNLSGNPEQEYFVAGMHDALEGAIGQISSVRVMWASTERYAKAKKPVPQLARELGVDAVVTAAIMQSGDSVRLQVRLIRTRPTERLIWSRSYARRVRDVLAMQSEVAQTVAREVDVKPTAQQEARLADAREVDPQTYEAYLRGMFYLNKSTEADFQKGLAYLQQAVEADPGNPLAYAGLAMGYATLGHGPAPPLDAWPRARAAALRAVTLDPMMAEAQAALANVKLYYEHDWKGAEQAFRRANELNPSLAMNHYHYAWYLALMSRMDEAVAEHKAAQRLDPLAPLHTAWLGDLYIYQGQYDKAIAEAKKCLEIERGSALGFLIMGYAYAAKGMYDSAVANHQRAVAANVSWQYALGRTYVLAGRREEALKILGRMEALPPTPWWAWGRAVLQTALGNKDEAFRWLSYEQPHAWVPWVRVDYQFESLRHDPRYFEFLRRLNLPK